VRILAPMTLATAAVRPQSFENHRAHSPIWIIAGMVLAVDVGFRVVEAVQEPSARVMWHAAAAAALLVVWFVGRHNAQIVQDRVIRLEMRLRLERALPPSQRGDVDRLSLGQLVALRFAGDAELPALVADVLRENIASRDDIKRRVKDWQADWLRV